MTPLLSSDATCITVQDTLTPSLLFPCHWLGGAAVPVHPGLQGDVQAFTGGAAEERVGCVRGAHPCGGQRCCATASEGSHIWIQSPPLLQRIPGNRQQCQNWQDAGGRWGVYECMWLCASSLQPLHVRMHVFMFTQFSMHSFRVWERTAAVHSRQWGQDYAMFKCGVFKHASAL